MASQQPPQSGASLPTRPARNDAAQRAQIRKEHARKMLEEQKIQRARRLWQKTEYLCTMKFRNTLPDPPLGPRFLKIPFGVERLAEFSLTTIDTTYKWQLHCERDLGVEIDIIDPGSYVTPEPGEVPLPEEDRAILEWNGSHRGGGGGSSSGVPAADDMSRTARRRRIDTDVTWLKKTVYLSNDPDGGHKFKGSQTAQAERDTQAREEVLKRRPQNPLSVATNSFKEAAAAAGNGKRAVVHHPEKKGVTQEWSIPVLPDLDLWQNVYTQVSFSEAPAQDEAIRGAESGKRKRVEKAIVRDMRKIMAPHGIEEFHVSYLVPTEGPSAKGGGSNDSEAEDGQQGGEYDWVKSWQANISYYGKTHQDDGTLQLLLVVDADAQKATYCHLAARLDARNLAAHERPLTAGKGAKVQRRGRYPKEAEDARNRLATELGLDENIAAAVVPQPPDEPDAEPDEEVAGSSSGGGGGGGGYGGGERFGGQRAMDPDQESVQTEPLESEASNIAVRGTEISEGGDELSRAGSDEDDL